MAAVPGARPPLGPPGRTQAQPGPRAPRITAGTNGATTGMPRQTEVRPRPSGWGVVRRRVSRTMVVALALLAVASAGVFQVLQTTRVTEAGYAVRNLEMERESLDANIRLLEARIATASNLEHLQHQAVDRLGMVPAEEMLRITVDVPAPGVVPLPRRYVVEPEREALPEPAWWEELIGSIPGFD